MLSPSLFHTNDNNQSQSSLLSLGPHSPSGPCSTTNIRPANYGTSNTNPRVDSDRGSRGIIEGLLHQNLHTPSSFSDDISRDGGPKIHPHLSSDTGEIFVRSSPSSQLEYHEICSGTNTYATSQFLPPQQDTFLVNPPPNSSTHDASP